MQKRTQPTNIIGNSNLGPISEFNAIMGNRVLFLSGQRNDIGALEDTQNPVVKQ